MCAWVCVYKCIGVYVSKIRDLQNKQNNEGLPITKIMQESEGCSER